MSIGDNSAALEIMRDANKDFLEFILNLRQFLTVTGPVTFNIGEGYTVSSIRDLIDDYRNGKFDTLILGGTDSGSLVRLHVDSQGNLVISDMQGNLATLLCTKVAASQIDNCDVNSLEAYNCRIDSIKGATSVTGGRVQLASLTLSQLTTDILDALSAEVQQLVVTSSISCPGILSYGSRKFVPKTTRNVFYRNNQALNNAASLLELSPTGEWVMTEYYNGAYNYTRLKPYDFGIRGGALSRVPPVGTSVPDLIKLHGNTRYTDFTRTMAVMFTYPMVLPANVTAYVAAPTGTVYTRVPVDGSPEFAAAMMWPTAMTPEVQSGAGMMYFTSFASTDFGKEIYYEVHDNPWKIYRRMRVDYDPSDNSVPVGVSFEGLVELPEYTCSRYIVRAHDSLFDNPSTRRTVIYSLE